MDNMLEKELNEYRKDLLNCLDYEKRIAKICVEEIINRMGGNK